MSLTAATVEQIGVPLGALTMTGAAQAITFTCNNRLNAIVAAIGDDQPFLYSNLVAGPWTRVPSGGAANLPIYKIQVWYFLQDATVTGANVRFTTVG